MLYLWLNFPNFFRELRHPISNKILNFVIFIIKICFTFNDLIFIQIFFQDLTRF
jgi:hypothetical protein